MNFLIGVSAHSVTFILLYTTQIAKATAKSSFHCTNLKFLMSVIFKKITKIIIQFVISVFIQFLASFLVIR